MMKSQSRELTGSAIEKFQHVGRLPNSTIATKRHEKPQKTSNGSESSVACFLWLFVLFVATLSAFDARTLTRDQICSGPDSRF
jgi:hypothetical protein